MTNYYTKTLLIITLFIVHSCAIITLETNSNLLHTMQAEDIIQSQLLATAPSVPTLSLTSTAIKCQQYEILNNQNVCIKPHYIEGCEVYESASSCYKCANGYSLNSKKLCDYQPLFIGVVTHIVGCIQQSSDKCEVCGQGFYKKDNKCLLGTRNCATYNNYGQCSQCQQDYSLILSQCRKNNLLGCKYETESHTCQQCYAPFTLNGQHCDINECRIMNDYGCTSCECGFYLTPERDCKQIAPGCLRYEKGMCKDCLPHYKLKGGVCEIEGCAQYSGNYCKQCSDKYELIEGECKFKNCQDWLNDQCLTCNQGFGVKDGLCIPAKPVSCE